MRKLQITLFSLLLPLALLAQLSVSSFFSDHMVLQRNQPLPVWGTAAPDAEVTVQLGKTTTTAQADSQGKWRAIITKQKLGNSRTLKVSAEGEVFEFKDVLIGDVWLASGQSNMEWNVAGSQNADTEIAAAHYPNIRLLDIPRTYSRTPLDTIDAKWQVCSPETISSFSAVAYYFGRKLHEELSVPIGLISSNWGGTPAEAWTPIEVLEADPDYAGILALREEMDRVLAENADKAPALKAAYDSFQEKVFAMAEGVPAPSAEWFDPEYTTDGLHPVKPKETLMSETDGLSYVRSTFTLSSAQAARKGARVRLGQIDNFDFTWINAQKIGETPRSVSNSTKVFRDYPIPEGTLQDGENVVLLQIIDVYRDSKFGGGIEQPEIYWPSGDSVALDDWQMDIIVDLGPRPETMDRKARNTAAYLYNGMIAPLVPAAYQGVIWYQGESNAGRDPLLYYKLFPDMIESWRTATGQGDLPFYYVQLANYRERNDEPQEHSWAVLRDAQLQTLDVPNTGMAVTIDIGEAGDIHPANKQDVGLRLALWALAQTYGQTEAKSPLAKLPLIGKLFEEPIPHSGPLFHSAKIRGSEIWLSFDHTYGDLETIDGGAPIGFTIAEKDAPFQWAEARIEGNQVVVSHPKMKAPHAVRYGWATNPPTNLINSVGLPASPFRTDDRSLSTKP